MSYKHVVISGGVGKRLWPLSRKNFPKPFLNVLGERSLLQQTILRHQASLEHIIVTNEFLYYQTQHQLSELDISKPISYLLETVGKNTAPAILLAAFHASDDDILVVSPADHHISPIDLYQQTIEKATDIASETDTIVLIGITPTWPSTEYGYINLNADEKNRFEEKPDHKTAEAYIKEGNYVWNSGIFCFKVAALKEIIKTIDESFYNQVKLAYESKDDTHKIELSDVKSNSFDREVLEKTDRLTVIPSTFQWSDMGSFDELLTNVGNQTKTVSVNSKNLTAISESGKLVAVHDIDDMYLVETNDSILVGKKGMSSHVSQLVSKIESTESTLVSQSNTVHRPWGYYTILQESVGYKVKKIVVYPGCRLSLQTHNHRSEHWTCVKGSMDVVCGDKLFTLNENESTYIEKKQPHRLINNSNTPAEIIEVQCGDYLGEDDIVRLESDY